MGQKTHPLGFRLGITQKHKSAWFTNLNQYSELLKEDDQIRTYLKTLMKTASISNIYINRNSRGDQIELIIETSNYNYFCRTALGKASWSANNVHIEGHLS